MLTTPDDSDNKIEHVNISVPLWRNRDYLLLWSGQSISWLGGGISQLAVPLLVLALTGSAVQAGLLGALEVLPQIFLGLIAGALVDRWDRTGSAVPGKRGGSVGKLAPHKDFLLGRVKEKPDITMPELAEALQAETGTEAAPASLSRFLIRHGQRFKKNTAGFRTKPSRGRLPAR